jgi:hypothetical protein
MGEHAAGNTMWSGLKQALVTDDIRDSRDEIADAAEEGLRQTVLKYNGGVEMQDS